MNQYIDEISFIEDCMLAEKIIPARTIYRIVDEARTDKVMYNLMMKYAVIDDSDLKETILSTMENRLKYVSSSKFEG